MTETRPDAKFSWFIPIDGDGTHIGTVRAERPPTFEYLRDVVQTAEDEGFYSLLIPTRFANGLFDEGEPLAETWTMATALAAVTSRIRFLIALRPGFISPGLFAQMAATLDQIAGGRIDINIVPGGIQGDFERLGEESDHAHRYARAEEFIAACRTLWESPQPKTFDGDHVRLNGALCSPGPVGDGPKFYLGGASDAALGLAGRQSDVYLAWILPQDVLGPFFDRAREKFAEAGRTGSFGLRTHLIVRNTEAEAWDAAEDLLSEAAAVVKEQRSAAFTGTAMVGQRAQAMSCRRSPSRRPPVERHLNCARQLRHGHCRRPRTGCSRAAWLLETRNRRVHPVWLPTCRGVPTRGFRRDPGTEDAHSG